jgi:hypothetical protein
MHDLVKAMAFAVMAMTATGLSAQQAGANVDRLTIHVDGLSSEQRDAIANEFAQTGEFHISYACVPAGILVIEPSMQGSGISNGSQARTVVLSHVSGLTTTVLDRSAAEVEALCMNARNP